MSRNLILVCLLGVGIVPVPVQAQIKTGAVSVSDQNLTADEILVRAHGLYAEGKYAEAAAEYQRFLTSFSLAEEAQESVRLMLPRLALALLQMKKFSEAREAITAALAHDPPIDQHLRQDLVFWRSICEMQDEEYEAAGKSLKEFLEMFPPGAERNPNYVRQFPAIRQIPEARLLIGTCLVLEGKFLEAADYYASIKPTLDPVMRGRATVLELYSLVQVPADDRAMALVMEEFPSMGDLLQLVTFQTLTLEIGSRFLERKELRKAIICLQRVWSSERLLKHQEDRLANIESQLQAAEANPRSDPYTKFLYGRMATNVRREIASFQKIDNFDSALRMRLAMAYQAMNRYRESALIMEEMLNEMPPDPVVESASVNLVQSWNAIERWPKAIEAAQAFIEKFPDSESVPLVLYLEGIAEQKALDYGAAVATFDTITKKYPQSEFAPRAQFMKGFSLLLAERNQEAIEAFEEFPKAHPKHEMAEAVAYWRGMAYSLDKQFARSREVMDEYLDRFKDGTLRGSAVFRKAYCAQQMEDYQTSIKELTAFLKKYPGHEESSEARVLLGDALMNEGRMEEGIASFAGISKQDVRFYEEGVFKVGKAYKLMEENDKLLEHMKTFTDESPRSARVAEAIYQIGWVYRQREEPDKARDIYWDAITKYGADPSIRSVDDLFPAVARLYKGPEERAQYQARLRDLAEAGRRDQPTLAMRAVWAQAGALKKSDPEQAQAIFLEAAKLANVQSTNPLLLADFATALLAAGREEEGEAMWRDLVKWNPRAPQKDSAFAALGMLELQRGNEKAALGWFERFERETLGSVLFGKILLAKARLQEARGQYADARKSLERLLGNQFSSGKEKAEALYLIGEIYLKEGKPELAVPYFQRIYVMHGRWRPWVVKAYLASGGAFEKLEDDLSARRTYQELTENEDFADFEETEAARKRLNALGGPVPKEKEPAEG
jgi:tetratricopeptide (TPR) repeat protein